MTIHQDFNAIQGAAAFIQQQFKGAVDKAVVLGSGLGAFTDGLEIECEIPYSSIPHFPVSTVEGHIGKIVVGSLDGIRVLVLSGRFHYYEGYSASEVVFPIRVASVLGVKQLYISNAAGGVNTSFKVGDLMIIHDHISFSTINPLLGKNLDELGTRFPDMSEPYSKRLIGKAMTIAARLGIHVHQGVYFGVTGPSYETHAEYRMIQLVGAHAVGMSTTQEVIAAIHCGMEVFAMSVITDIGIREEENQISHEDVLEAAQASAPILTRVFQELILSERN
ncbi:MAG: purine-nucleoside phosphorylase [Bacteroidetes bacterium]|nr:purine-nucleoside phosphorylase [Bacteroidota bacterium]